jgi:hypothetical protein
MIVYSPTSIINGIFIYYRYPQIADVNDTPASQSLYNNLNNTLVQVQSAGLEFAFLQTYAILSTPDPTLSYPGYNFGFTLPPDYIRNGGVVNNNDYKIIGRAIYSNQSSLVLKYYRYDLSYNYPPHFYEYFVAFMANKYALTLTQSKVIVDAVEVAYQKTLQDAMNAELSNLSPNQNSYLPQQIFVGG